MDYRLELELSDKRMQKIVDEIQNYISIAKQAYQNNNWNGVNAAVGMASVYATLLNAERTDKLVKVIDHYGGINAPS